MEEVIVMDMWWLAVVFVVLGAVSLAGLLLWQAFKRVDQQIAALRHDHEATRRMIAQRMLAIWRELEEYNRINRRLWDDGYVYSSASHPTPASDGFLTGQPGASQPTNPLPSHATPPLSLVKTPLKRIHQAGSSVTRPAA
jgi:hypothetical protein